MDNMLVKWTTLALGLMCVVTLPGQQSMDDFFQNRLSELGPTNGTAISDGASDFSPPWIEQLTFRTKTDEFDLGRQEYVFRVSPTTPGIRNAQMRSEGLLRRRVAFETNELRFDFVDLVYEELLERYDYGIQLELQRELLLVLRDQERVRRRMTLAGEDPENWMRLRRNLINVETEILELESRQNDLRGNGAALDWSDFLSLESLLAYVQQNRPGTDYIAAKYDLERELVDSEMELETAERRRIFDFLEAEYGGPSADPFRERVSFTASFEINRSGNRQLKLQELAVERDLLERERRVELQLDAYDRAREVEKIERLVELLDTSKTRTDAQALLTDRIVALDAGREGTSPLLALYQREQRIKSALRHQEMEMDIYRAYLDYLETTLVLYELPMKNYFSERAVAE